MSEVGVVASHEVSRVTGLVSVIIPNYNHARYLGNAIQSVLQQSYPNFEIVVVDDGSTDQSPEVAAQFRGQVRYVRQRNQGLPSARNTGIRMSAGEYIALLDADDAYEPDFLRTLVGVLDDDPDAGAVYCGHRTVDEDDQPLPYGSRRVVAADHFYQELLYGNFLVPASLLARHHCYAAAGPFDPELRACEDWDMWLRFARRFRILGCPDQQVRYRIVTQSMSSDPERMLRSRIAVLEKHFMDEAIPALVDREKAFAEANLRAAVEFIQCKDLDAAFRNFEQAVTISPGLLRSARTFYELAWGPSGRGFSGDFNTLDPAESSQILLNMVDRLFVNQPELLAQYRAEAYANAHLVLAKLFYGVHRHPEARKSLLRSLRSSLKVTLKSEPWAIFARTFVPLGLLKRVRRARSASQMASI